MIPETKYFRNQCGWIYFDNYEEYIRIIADNDIYLAFVGLFKPLDMSTCLEAKESHYIVLVASELFPYSDNCIYPNFSVHFSKSPDDNQHITLTLKALSAGYEHYNRVIEVDVEPGKFMDEPRDKSATSFGKVLKRFDLRYANPKEEYGGVCKELTMDDIRRAMEYLSDEPAPRSEEWELTDGSEQPWLGVDMTGEYERDNSQERLESLINADMARMDRDEEIKAQNGKLSVYSGTQPVMEMSEMEETGKMLFEKARERAQEVDDKKNKLKELQESLANQQKAVEKHQAKLLGKSYEEEEAMRRIREEAKLERELERKTQMDILWSTIKNASQ